IDLKSFDEDYYKNILHGDLETVKLFIERAAESCHVEVTTLIIPNENDTVEEVESIAGWLASVGEAVGKDIPLHITRFFPRSRYSDRRPTPVDTIYTLIDVAKKHLKYVHAGNV
ncbi:MAG: radical SAM protein, partial [Eubacterium sp.]|nr:radical SAM protein [Eubacterium sp.]